MHQTDAPSLTRIWFVSEVYYPEETATAFILTGIAEELARSLSVSVLCGQPKYDARGRREAAQEEHNGVHIRRSVATTLNKDVIWRRGINLITIGLSLFVQGLLRFKRHDQVLVVTNPPLLPFLTVLACRLKGAKCLLIVHDVYPEVFVAAGALRRPGAALGFLTLLNRWLYRSMDRVIVLGRDMAELVKQKLGGNDSRVVIVPNWADLEEVKPASRAKNTLLAELGLDGRFVIQYAGNMGRTHDLESLIASAVRLSDRQDIHFLLIGGGAKRSWVEKAIREEGLSNVTVLPMRPRRDQANFLNACDISVIAYMPGMVGVSVPSRMYNVMAAGKPILAATAARSELAQVVEEERIGWVVPTQRPDRIVEVILEAYANRELLAEMSQRARAAVEKKYSLAQVIQRYRAILDDRGDEPSPAAAGTRLPRERVES